MSENQKLAETVNQSGFPLQIGVANTVSKTNSQHGWKVLYQEHSWRNDPDDCTGFIDLILENEYGTSVLIVECKRVLDSSWIFLNPTTTVKHRRHAKAWITRYTNGNFKHFDWHDLAIDPATPEAEYCVVPGQDAKSKPMLERIAADLVSATEGYASEEKLFQSQAGDALRMYFSVIVTTANLKLCSFDPDEISLSDGRVSAPKFLAISYVRFRKQLSTRQPSVLSRLPTGLNSLVRAKEHTVFVVNAESITHFLSEFDIDNGQLRPFV